MSADSGKFSGTLPYAATTLLVECAAYQSRLIPIQRSTGKASVVVIIPLLPVTEQAKNKPYRQTEQTAYVQDNETRSAGHDTAGVQRGIFRVFDATRNTPLPATVCFFFTKSGRKTCLTTNASGQVSLAFRERDIVALEASASDYEPYAGNLVIEQLGGSSVKHAIPMNRTLTLLAVEAKGATRCMIRVGQQIVPLTVLQPGRFAAYDLLPGQYELSIGYGKHAVQRTVDLRSGLNWTSFTKSADTIAIVKSPRPATAPEPSVRNHELAPSLLSIDSIPMIYFEQSSYVLRPDSQRVLQQVAQYMKTHPDYTLEITGHTDNVGTPSLNQTLSMYRAMVTASFLARQGVDDDRFIKAGLGGNQPLATNDTEINKARNRRVSLKLISTR
ncbi:OmpA family protein [Spirosoma rhododendri]|uniref:OmpA family protein n=1 Tax=Spirosoma rhododendri TaxID=2728024 RepID=A0A7L5DN20_9BACT|nr:OmpA family protein [Spirosoma rhododendri]QJD78881.1 OmpA family protein [Spirosoma rhododendri]